jgi:hypothetical protein
MATTAKITLTAEQRASLARDLRIGVDAVPDELAVVAISPEAGASLGLPSEEAPRFSPALIIT